MLLSSLNIIPRRALCTVFLVIFLSGCSNSTDVAETTPQLAEAKTAIFAAGCFWCVEEAFDKVDGVLETTSGFIGGSVKNPTYKQVVSGNTGHTEALRVRFDPEQVSYAELLSVFWRNVDPTDAGGQFCDRGSQYRSGIFYLNNSQAQTATQSKQSVASNPKAPAPIVTEITAAGPFYEAEDYHQNYHNENPLRYRYYKSACGRADRLEALWGEVKNRG